MTCLDALVVSGLRHDNPATGFGVIRGLFENSGALSLCIKKVLQQHVSVRHVEIPARILRLRFSEDISISQRDCRIRIVEGHLVAVIIPQNIHRQTFQPVGQLARNRMTVVAANLLEIGELTDFHPVAPDLPAKTPCAQRRAFPVVLDKSDVVQRHIDPDGTQRTKVQLLQVRRAGFDDDLVLVIVLPPVGAVTIAAICRTPRGLHIGCSPRLRSQTAQCGCRVECSGPHFHVVGLQHGTALPGPIMLEPQDYFLE